MKLSIRYDLGFQEAVLRYTDDQLEANCNPDHSPPSLTQEQRCNQSLMMLCDTVDRYCERRVEALRSGLASELKKDG